MKLDDREFTTRPEKGWTHWRAGGGRESVEATWWAAKPVHFPKHAMTAFFDGSEFVGLEDWGCNPWRWCMKRRPADWQPMPPGYRQEAEGVWLAYRSRILHQERHTALLRCRKWPLDPLPRWCWPVQAESD